MKKVVLGIVIVMVAGIIAAVVAGLKFYGPGFGIYISKPSPEKYVQQSVTFMDNGIYAGTDEWKKKKEEVLEAAKTVESFEDAYPIIEEAVKVAGGKHSQLWRPDKVKEENESYTAPECSIKDGIITVKLPAFNGDRGDEYMNTVLDFLRDNKDAKGVIIDLRGNRGGDMGPMAGAVSPLLPDGDLMFFNIRGGEQPVYLEEGKLYGSGTGADIDDPFKMKGIKVAVLTDENTASSAEATLICFLGLDYVKTFGMPTAGYASSNVVYKLYDKAQLLVTVGSDVDRNGNVYCEDPIEPDVETDDPVKEAVKWINN